jgi:multidrug efflux pump subunit AcrB
MRVWLRPDRMAEMGITMREVANAIQSQNQTFGIGQIGARRCAGRAAVLRGHRPAAC